MLFDKVNFLAFATSSTGLVLTLLEMQLGWKKRPELCICAKELLLG
jgi:hypothetical protein